MTTIKKKHKISVGKECGETGALQTVSGNVIIWYSWLQKTVWLFLKKLKMELPYDPASPLLDIYSKELKAESQRGMCTYTFTAALFPTAESGKQPKCPSSYE